MGERILLVRRLGIVCVALTFLLMVLGAWVKATGSGLSCPDWPACYGEWLPPFPSAENGGTWTREVDGRPVTERVTYTQAQILYEWAHRAVVGLIIVPVGAFAWLASRGRDHHPLLRRLPLAAVGIYLLQAGLGAVTVLVGNQPWATTMHLAMAVVWFAVLLTATCVAHLKPYADPPLRQPVPPIIQPAAPARGFGYVYPGEEPVAPVRLPGEGHGR
jgi:heme a synthase